MSAAGIISPEAQLLLRTARPDEREGAAGGRLLGRCEWHKLAYLAEREGATVILWRWLGQKNRAIPADLARRWQNLAMVSEFQMRHLERLLNGVLDVLARRNIPVVLLKGSALARTHYGSFIDRPMGDLDLLVRPEQAREAWSALQEHGWSWPAAAWPEERYGAHQHLPPLINTRGNDARVEIHTELLPAGHPFDWPVRDVWARAHPLASSPGGETFVPHGRDLLLHLCVHFAWSHEMQWGGWRTLRDVAAVTERGDVDWHGMVGDARRARAATCCYWTLRLARTGAGATIPEHVLTALRPPRPEFLCRRLERHYLRQLFETERSCPSESLTKALWDFGIAPRWNHHGTSRPWHVSERLTAARPTPAAGGWTQRARDRLRHAAHAMAYLRRLAVT